MAGISHAINVMVRGSDKLTGSLNKSNKSLGMFTNQVNKAKKASSGLKTPQFKTTGIKKYTMALGGLATASAAAGAALGFGLKKATDKSEEFQKGFAEVATLLPGGEKKLGYLKEELYRLSSAMGDLPTDSVKTLYTTISAGFTGASEATEVLETSMKLAIGGVTDTETAVDGLTSALNAYNLTASDSGYVSDLMFTAVRVGKTKVDALAKSIGIVAPTANQMNVSLAELLGTISTLTLGGLSTGEAVTGIRSMLAAVAQQTKESMEQAKKMGIGFTEKDIKKKGIVKFLMDIGKAAGGNKNALSKLFGRIEALNAVMVLTGASSDKLTMIINEMETSVGATDKAYYKMAGTLAQTKKRLSASFQILQIQIGQSLLPLLTKLADAIKVVTDSFLGFQKVNPGLVKILTITSAITAAIFAVIGAGGLMAMGLMSAASVAGLSMAGLLMPIGAVLAILISTIAAVALLNEEFTETSGAPNKMGSNFLDPLIESTNKLLYSLGFLTGTIDGLIENVTGKKNGLLKFFDWIKVSLYDSFRDSMMGIVNQIASSLTTGLDLISSFIVNASKLFVAFDDLMETWWEGGDTSKFGGVFKDLLVSAKDDFGLVISKNAENYWERQKNIHNGFAKEENVMISEQGMGLMKSLDVGFRGYSPGLSSHSENVNGSFKDYLPQETTMIEKGFWASFADSTLGKDLKRSISDLGKTASGDMYSGGNTGNQKLNGKNMDRSVNINEINIYTAGGDIEETINQEGPIIEAFREIARKSGISQ